MSKGEFCCTQDGSSRWCQGKGIGFRLILAVARFFLLFKSSPEHMRYVFIDEREREREKHWWFASCECSYWGPNLQPPFSAQDDAPTNWATWPGCARQDACQGQWEKGTVSRQPGFGRTGDRGDDLQPHSGSPFPFCLLYLVSISVYLLQGESQASPSLQGLSLFGDLKKKKSNLWLPHPSLYKFIIYTPTDFRGEKLTLVCVHVTSKDAGNQI